VTDGRGAHDRAARGLELANGGGVEGVDRGHHLTIQRGIELAPLTAGNDRTCRQTEWREHPSDPKGSAGNISPNSVTVGRSDLPETGA
jgi:hypothetical protein